MFSIMKDEEMVRVLDFSRKSSEYRAEEGFAIKQAKVVDDALQVIIYSRESYKIISVDLTGSGATELESKKFLKDYGSNLGVIIHQPGERLKLDSGLDTKGGKLIALDRAEAFFKIERHGAVNKLIFSGELPKENFNPRDILAERNATCSQLWYTVQENEKSLLWAEVCAGGLYVWKCENNGRKSKIGELRAWDGEAQEVLEIKEESEFGFSLMVRRAGFLAKWAVSKGQKSELWKRAEELADALDVGLYLPEMQKKSTQQPQRLAQNLIEEEMPQWG